MQCNQPVDQYNCLTNVLWYNHNIRINHNCANYKHWSKKGIYYVCDLLDEKGGFLTLADFIAKFNVKTNFLEYGGIIKAINNSFGSTLTGTNGASTSFLFTPFKFRLLLRTRKNSGLIDICQCSAKKVMNLLPKWETKLNVNLTKSNWMILCNMPFSSTNDTRLRCSNID